MSQSAVLREWTFDRCPPGMRGTCSERASEPAAQVAGSVLLTRLQVPGRLANTRWAYERNHQRIRRHRLKPSVDLYARPIRHR